MAELELALRSCDSRLDLTIVNLGILSAIYLLHSGIMANLAQQ